LAEQADRPLLAGDQSEWLERLEADAGNLAVAIDWYLAHDPAPLPHLFRVLWPFWSTRDLHGEARVWVSRLLPDAGSLGPQARAELEWAAAAIASEVGDDVAALAARERLGPLLAAIEDPFLHAACQLVMAWTSPISGDFERALREASASLEEFGGQDEPFSTALAAFTTGSLETAVGRYDDALRHLREARDLAERFDSIWLAAGSRVQLGILDIAQGRPEQARALLDEALDLSLAARSVQFVSQCLAAFARLAVAEGDPEQAALLEGAAEGLRQRVGLHAWPMLRQDETELVAQGRQALGAAGFDRAFAAGSGLSQREAVAAVRDWRGTGQRVADDSRAPG
ncbi:MAG TPA: tetratricopeptide repeat protein, partial [Streptosporangiaceae bacterium]